MKQLLKLSAASLLVVGALSVQASTLSDVQAKGHVSCGVSKVLLVFLQLTRLVHGLVLTLMFVVLLLLQRLAMQLKLNLYH